MVTAMDPSHNNAEGGKKCRANQTSCKSNPHHEVTMNKFRTKPASVSKENLGGYCFVFLDILYKNASRFKYRDLKKFAAALSKI